MSAVDPVIDLLNGTFIDMIDNYTANMTLSEDIMDPLFDTIKTFISKDIAELIEIIFSDTLGCSAVNGIFRSFGVFVCCDFMGNFPGGGATTYIIKYNIEYLQHYLHY